MFHDENELPSWFTEAVIDRLTAVELVELLALSVEQIVDAFAFELKDNFNNLIDELGLSVLELPETDNGPD